jgi:hypothetical protein
MVNPITHLQDKFTQQWVGAGITEYLMVAGVGF